MLLWQNTQKSTGRLFLLLIAVCCFATATAFGQYPGAMDGMSGMGRPGGMGIHRHPGDHDPSAKKEKKPDDSKKEAKAQPFLLTRHGGGYLRTPGYVFEVVWMPNQARIYFYDAAMNPLSAQAVHVQMSYQLSDRKESVRTPFQYVLLAPGSTEQDYVVAGFDARMLGEKDAPVTFDFFDLPAPSPPTATFSPLVVKTDVRPYAVQVLPSPAELQSVSPQQVCPVCGSRLGNQGTICKVYISDYPLLVCKKDCATAVRATPNKFLPPTPTAQRQ